MRKKCFLRMLDVIKNPLDSALFRSSESLQEVAQSLLY